MRKYGQIKYFTVVAAILITIAGCGGGGPAAPSPEPGQMNNNQTQDREMTRKAEEAVRISETEQGVERAHAVVHETSTLLVGIVPESNVSNEEKMRIERDLEQKISREVEGVNRVMVTTEDEHAGRIRDIERDVMSGKPLSDLGKDTRDVFDRLTNMRR